LCKSDINWPAEVENIFKIKNVLKIIMSKIPSAISAFYLLVVMGDVLIGHGSIGDKPFTALK